MKKEKKKITDITTRKSPSLLAHECMPIDIYIIYLFLHNWVDIVKCFVTFSFRIARFFYGIFFFKNSVSGYIIFHLMDAAPVYLTIPVLLARFLIFFIIIILEESCVHKALPVPLMIYLGAIPMKDLLFKM